MVITASEPTSPVARPAVPPGFPTSALTSAKDLKDTKSGSSPGTQKKTDPRARHRGQEITELNTRPIQQYSPTM